MAGNGRKKVLFIIHDLHQQDNHFPVGIGYLASVLQKNDVDVQVICADVYHFSNEYIQAYIKDWKPDVIGVGFLAARFKDSVLPLCNAINQVKGKAKLILGGHGASPIPEYMVKHPDIDADGVIIGEGEGHMSQLLLQVRMDWPNGWSMNGSPIQDLDTIPFPAWDLFPIDEYARCLKLPGWEPGDRTLGIVTSRGCVGKCTFCYRMTKGLRQRSIDNVIEEMVYLNNVYGINYFFPQDELFVSSKKRMFEFHEGLRKSGLLGSIKFSCASRVNLIDEDLLECLKSAGCVELNYGFESMDDNVLRLMKKGTTAEHNERAARLTKKAGMPFNINMLWGNIGDTVWTLSKDLAFITEYDQFINIRTIRPPTPYPGSELYDYAVEHGMLKGPDDFFEKFTNSDRLTVNFTDMPDDEFYRNLYEANEYLVQRYYHHQASKLTSSFHDCYYKNTDFRGARHYA